MWKKFLNQSVRVAFLAGWMLSQLLPLNEENQLKLTLLSHKQVRLVHQHVHREMPGGKCFPGLHCLGCQSGSFIQCSVSAFCCHNPWSEHHLTITFWLRSLPSLVTLQHFDLHFTRSAWSPEAGSDFRNFKMPTDFIIRFINGLHPKQEHTRSAR